MIHLFTSIHPCLICRKCDNPSLLIRGKNLLAAVFPIFLFRSPALIDCHALRGFGFVLHPGFIQNFHPSNLLAQVLLYCDVMPE